MEKQGGKEKDSKDGHPPPVSHQALSALFYAVSSVAIISANKLVLTSYSFPSANVVAFAQMVFTVVSLRLAKAAGIVSFPAFDSSTFRKVFPLPLLFLMNLVTGLGGTQRLNLPMFTVMRRFSIFFTMVLESFILGTPQTTTIQLSVFLMLGGSVLAAFNDLAFDMQGYVLILLNDVFTAANGVYLKKKLDAKELGNFGLMYYNSLLSLPLLFCFLVFNGEELQQAMLYPRWEETGFLLCFCASGLMGVVLTYSIFLCTQLNSALTTTVVGCFKNIFVSYVGMFLGGDYVFQALNFAGLNISIFGSIVYAYFKFKQQGTAVL